MPSENRQKKKSRDTAVQGTNDSSSLSKVSAAARGYFKDPFLQHFVCKVARRAPLINRGYYVRWKAVDLCIRRFLQVTAGCPKRQILSLGAGFDSLYFRLHATSSLDRCVVFEVDFPDVARRKTALINANQTLRDMLKSPQTPSDNASVGVCSDLFFLCGVDLRELDRLEEVLVSVGLDSSAPTLVLSEVVLTYMETQRSDAVVSWAARLLPLSLFVVYEQIRPHDAFGRIMQEHFTKLNSSLHALRHYPDTTAQRQRFLDRGWDGCECVDMNEFFLRLLDEEERRRLDILEPFDEYEEWHLKCSHYFILTASRGALMANALLPSSTEPSLLPLWGSSALTVRAVPVCLEGVGMASSCWRRGQVLLTGGSSRAGRGADLRVLLRGRRGCRSVSTETSSELGVRLYHTATPLPAGGAVVYGGRSSPLSPAAGLLRVTLQPCDPETEGPVKVCVEPLACSGATPPPRWRHTATTVKHRGRDFLFVFGGRSQCEAALGDSAFLSLDHHVWTEVPVEGDAPLPRHSHSACSFQGGAVVFGGLSGGGVPLGDTAVLRPTERGFQWEMVEVQPPPVPRYSHRAHLLEEALLLLVVGGVWLHSEGVPGVLVIDLKTGSTLEFRLDMTSVPWPLMLHSFCSELTGPRGPSGGRGPQVGPPPTEPARDQKEEEEEEEELLLVGGGGNCFSFGTHLNQQPVCLDLRDVLQRTRTSLSPPQ